METRPAPDGRITRRRRCKACSHDFRTVEQLAETGLYVRRANGNIEKFQRAAVSRSIIKAVVHPYPKVELDKLVDAVLSTVYILSKEGPIPTNAIGHAILAELRKVDPASHVRYALVHSGRQDRSEYQQGWANINDLRQWLAREYPELHYHKPPGGLTWVVKRDERREPYDRRKLERSIGIASIGRGTKGDVWQLATEVAATVDRLLGDQPIVTSGQISSEILRILRRWDHIAYMRYASTTKAFTSAEDYETEAAPLRHIQPKRPDRS